ncbi:hypothetical protein IAU59_002575 [Kwoniella sp. CBS 9459]
MPAQRNQRPSTAGSAQPARNRRRASDVDAALPMFTQTPLSNPPPGALLGLNYAPAPAARRPAPFVAGGPHELQPQPQPQPQPHLHHPRYHHGQAHPTLERRASAPTPHNDSPQPVRTEYTWIEENPGEQHQQQQHQQTRTQSQRTTRAKSSGQRRPLGQKATPNPNIERLQVERLSASKGSLRESVDKASSHNSHGSKTPFSTRVYDTPTGMYDGEINSWPQYSAAENFAIDPIHAGFRPPIADRRSPFRPSSGISRRNIPPPLSTQLRHRAGSRHEGSSGQRDTPSSSASSSFTSPALITPPRSAGRQQEALPPSASPPSAPLMQWRPMFEYVSLFEDEQDLDRSQSSSPDAASSSMPFRLEGEVPRRGPVGLGLDLGPRAAPPRAAIDAEVHRHPAHGRSRVAIGNLVHSAPPLAIDNEAETEPDVLHEDMRNRGLALLGIGH